MEGVFGGRLAVLIQLIDRDIGLISANFHTRLLFVVGMHIETREPTQPYRRARRRRHKYFRLQSESAAFHH